MEVTRDSYTVTSNVKGSTHRLSIDESATEHIMSMLTDLYADPEKAVLREYTTNGLDAHVEAGIDRPIEVTIPSAMSPFLVVRDFGTGLSHDDIRDIYSRYGTSTKRNTNEQVGMLGLGCKSALTYADQFTLSSVKNGHKIAVIVSRDEDGAGSMTVVDDTATTEPEGTTVTIPAKRQHDFAAKAAEFFSYWPEGSVLVNGEPPAKLEGIRITPTIFLTKPASGGYYRTQEHTIVMGNVPYPVPGTELAGVPDNVKLVAFVPIGSVNFPPARESLMLTKRTRETLAQVAKDFAANKAQALTREMNICDDHGAALDLALEWGGKLGISDFSTLSYKGVVLPKDYGRTNLGLGHGEHPLVVDQGYRYRSYRSGVRQREVPLSMWRSALWVENFSPSKCDADQRRKLAKWCEDADVEPTHYILLPPGMPAPSGPWVNPQAMTDWPTVRQIKLSTTKTMATAYKPARIPGSYDVYDAGDYKAGVPGDDLDQSRPILWHHGNRWSGSQAYNRIRGLVPNCQVVCLPGGRITKFKRDVPTTKSVQEAMDAEQQKWLARLSRAQRIALYCERQYQRDQYRPLELSRIDDADLREAVAACQMEVGKETATMRERGWIVEAPAKWVPPLHQYPLYNGRVFKAHKDHAYHYLNTAYAARKAGT